MRTFTGTVSDEVLEQPVFMAGTATVNLANSNLPRALSRGSGRSPERTPSHFSRELSGAPARLIYMAHERTAEPVTPRPYRLWPGVVAAVVQWSAWLGIPALNTEWAMFGMLSAVGVGVLIFAWWVAFSRASWVDRLGTLLLIAVGFAVTTRVVHPSIANGMMGMMPIFYAIAIMSLAVVASAVVGSGRSSSRRWMAKGAAVAFACAALAAIRTDGIRGAGGSDVRWRWSPSAEERLLAQGADSLATESASLPTSSVTAETKPAAPPKPEPTAAKANTSKPITAQPTTAKTVTPAKSATTTPSAAAPKTVPETPDAPREVLPGKPPAQ